MKKHMLTLAGAAALAATLTTGCTVATLGANTGVPVPLTSGVTSTYDPGQAGQYPATVHHYSGDVQEDVAGDDCAARGGSLIDDSAERFVCVTD